MPLLLYAMIACLGASIVWSSISRIDEVVTARGRLVSIDNHVVLQSSESAQVASIRAAVGQRVRQGEVLVTFDPTNVGADHGQIRERLNSLDAQVRRLEAERDGQPFRPQTGKDDAEQRQVEQQRRANYIARMGRFE